MSKRHQDDDELPWEDLFDRADRAVRETLAELPPPIRSEAEKIPLLLRHWPPPDRDECLGEYIGFEEHEITSEQGAIFLYVGMLHDFCVEEDLEFETEVRRTYLHELGHALGLDEPDLEDRGLD